MELGIQNFTPAGNNLVWRKGWRKYQENICKESKGAIRNVNKTHYDRILYSLTDNRSIDVLNEPSIKDVKKMDPREYIIKYIHEYKDKKSIREMTEGLMIALEVPVEETSGII
jgi:hypothetical protein